MKLSVVILNYNTKDYTLQCLQSISESSLSDKTQEIEVLLADNGSTDGSVEAIKLQYPWVKIIENRRNIGFSAGNNRALKQAKGKIILLLNSDTKVFPDTFKEMLEFFATHKQAGAATARLMLPDGALDLACHRGFPTPVNPLAYFLKLEQLFPEFKPVSGYHQTWKNFNTIHEVDVISGACFFIRKQVLDQVGLLDERYFMYAEDIDWCMRIKKSGWKIYYNPNSKIIHCKKRSGRSKSEGLPVNDQTRKLRAQTIIYFYDTMRIFYDQYYREKYGRLVRAVVLLGIYLFTKVKLLRNRLV